MKYSALVKVFSLAACLFATSYATTASATLVPTGLKCDASVRTDNTVLNPSYVGCVGAYSGNMDNQLPEIKALLSSKGYVTTYFSSENFVDLGNPFTSTETTNTTGWFNFDAPITGTFTIGIKQGNAFSLYFFDAAKTLAKSVSAIAFDSLGVKANSQSVYTISHAGFFGAPTTKVPEPSSVLLFGLGLFGLVLARRKAA